MHSGSINIIQLARGWEVECDLNSAQLRMPKNQIIAARGVQPKKKERLKSELGKLTFPKKIGKCQTTCPSQGSISLMA
jgi:hypothetical protein